MLFGKLTLNLMLKWFLFSLLFVGCSDINNNKTKKTINAEEVIVSAMSFPYADLDESYKDKLKIFKCYPNNWRKGVKFDKENAFFVKARINNQLLAMITESRAFDSNTLLRGNKYMLYGKYQNNWEFTSVNGQSICQTKKFHGFNLIELDRNGDIDEVLIGPIPEKPSIMSIRIHDSKNYPSLKPSYKF